RVAHDLVAFKLNRARVDRYSGGEITKSVRQTRRVPDGEIWFRCWTKVVERLQETKACLRYERTTVIAHTADRFRHPCRIACEELIVFRRAQEANDAQLDDEIINDLLRLFLGDRS